MAAVVKLITKLRNHSEFTHIAYVGAENGGGLAMVEGMAARELSGAARRRWMLSR